MAPMSNREQSAEVIERAAGVIHGAFCTFQDEFREVTRRARTRFEQRDWHGFQQDTQFRLALYTRSMDRIIDDLRGLLGTQLDSEGLWTGLKSAYSSIIAGERNLELAETFFNSATRRVFSTVGVNPDVEYVTLEPPDPHHDADPTIYHRYGSGAHTALLVRRILLDYEFEVPYEDLERDARLAARVIDGHLRQLLGRGRIEAVETVRSVFFRGKGAYIVGRVRTGNRLIPLILSLRNTDRGVSLDAVLCDPSEISILFSFTRAYFHVEVDCPRELVAFIKSIMPLKPTAELYIALGFNKHGKTELYRDLQRHLENSSDRFRIAEGDAGMVMIVFSLTFYDVVFKVIRDRFAYPKNTTRRDVMEHYHLVFQHDRVGRLVDAQEFEHLTFRRELFESELLDELVSEAANSVSVDGDEVVIRHLYTERKLTPLNLYLRRSTARLAREAVFDYGSAIKELAAANIFPGDFLLKNFGVTRHGRIVFYDYDELCLLTDCNFRRMPPSRCPEDELEAEPWFNVGPDDIFPEEFQRFLGIQEPLRDEFVRQHGDLFTVEFWQRLQQRHRDGEIVDVFPYPDSRRFRI
jgi:isocitrate dehydrogenase kinase/phosphatase